MWHVMWLQSHASSSLIKIKIKIKSRKIDKRKRKRKILVSKHTITQACLLWWPSFSQHILQQYCNHLGITPIQLSLLWCYGMLWTLTFFFFFYLFFLILYFFSFEFLFLFLFSNNEEAHDIAITWHVTWCDVIGLEHSKRIWKIMLEHIYTT